jgi:3-keto-L-gulonate-6-phosphate decarboxylase
MSKQKPSLKSILDAVHHANDSVRDTLHELKDDVKSVKSDISDINITVAKQHVSLDEHMRRTEVNEKSIQHLKEAIKPLETHVATFGALAKLIGIFAAVATVVGVILSLAEYFGGN